MTHALGTGLSELITKPLRAPAAALAARLTITGEPSNSSSTPSLTSTPFTDIRTMNNPSRPARHKRHRDAGTAGNEKLPVASTGAPVACPSAWSMRVTYDGLCG